MPRFSIVITTTRPDVVEGAVRSALAQDFKDLEVIVSDNSDAGCSELLDMTDRRLRYVRPTRYLPLVDHWNFAFSHATGEWQTLLCDDFAVPPSLLAIVDEEIRLNQDIDTVRWGSAVYVDGDWWLEDQRHRLTIPSFTGQRVKLDAKRVIAEMFESGTGLGSSVKHKVPIIPNAVYSRRIIERIRQQFGGNLFEPICPMTSAALAALALSDYTLQVDLPLTVKGSHKHSAAGHFADPATYRRMLLGTSFRHIPLKTTMLFPCTAAETVLHTQSLLPDLLGAYRLNWNLFFVNCYAAIRELEEQGLKMHDVHELFRKAVHLFPFSLRARVWGAILNRRAWDAIRSPNVRSSVMLRPLRRIRRAARQCATVLRSSMSRKERASSSQLLDTRQVGLNSITDCANYLERLLSNQRGIHRRLADDVHESYSAPSRHV